jgi:mannose-1-phosphate guanylyltransferase / mannose-6-phosphate isomerase
MGGRFAVILAGGSGTRFWPLSRESYPKQLLNLVGTETMLQRTVSLAGRVTDRKGRIVVVSQDQQADAVRQQVNRESGPASSILLLEPFARNTAAAIGYAAVTIYVESPDSVLVVMPADHMIRKRGAFLRAVRKAAKIAEKGYLVTLGIRPDRPETGFGYIQAGRLLQGVLKDGQDRPRSVGRFVEKPDRDAAARYLKRGNYYWNSGIFVFQSGAILDAIKRHMPRLARGLGQIRKALGTADEKEVRDRVYRALPSVSIDYGVMERVDKRRLAVLPVDIGWSDVGSWSALHDVLPLDREGNIRRGNMIALDCRNSILYGDRRPVAAIGMEDMVVVDTPDATLVCRTDRVQDVRKVVEILKKKGAEEHKTPKTVERPWGTFTVLESGANYKIKRIVVNPGNRLSLQLHKHRSEHWVVVSGAARITRDDEEFEVRSNESTYIPKGARHRISNPGTERLEIIEVQNGDYLGEDDIVRFQDDYGRIKHGHLS